MTNPADLLQENSRSSSRRTSPRTTPARSSACRTAPRHWAVSSSPDGCGRPNCRHTTRWSPNGRSARLSSPLGRCIPTPLSRQPVILPRVHCVQLLHKHLHIIPLDTLNRLIVTLLEIGWIAPYHARHCACVTFASSAARTSGAGSSKPARKPRYAEYFEVTIFCTS